MDFGTDLKVRKTAARRWVARAIGTLTAVAGIGLIASGQALAADTLTVTVFSDTTLANHQEGVTYTTWGANGIATFTDSAACPTPTTCQPAADYTATIFWGDGTPTTSGTIGAPAFVSGTTGSYNIAATHAFVDEKSGVNVGFPVKVNVTDTVDVATGKGTSTGIAVKDQCLGFPSGACPPVSQPAMTFSAINGTSFSGVIGSFKDANQIAVPADGGPTPTPEYSLSITWGDGTAVDTASGTFAIGACGTAPGLATGQGCAVSISGTHTYTSAGTKNVVIVVGDGSSKPTLTVNSTGTVTGANSCTSVTLTPASPINVAAGSTINLMATAVGCSSPQFKYWIGYSNGTWQVLRDWGAAAFTWNTNPAARGHYLVHVWANQVPSATWEQYAEAKVNLTVCASATLTPLNVTQPAGSTVALSATSTGCLSPTYEFWIGYSNGTWQVLRTWGGPTYNWVTNPASPGTYTIHVWANNTGDSLGAWEAYGTESVTLT
jgi:hypothetical protein